MGVQQAAPRTVPRPLPPPAADDEAAGRAGGWWMLGGVIVLGLLLLGTAGGFLIWHQCQTKGGGAQTASTDHSPPPQPHDAADHDGQADPSRGQPPPPPPKPPEPPWLPEDKQDKVNAAIERGVAFLESQQSPQGTWGFDHPTGLAALPGLTLLECGVPADDPRVQKAADFVRRSVPRLSATYELALAILFLDRLGDRQDDPLIQTMALRLLAGQMPSGGWTYGCPILSPKDESGLAAVLQTTRPHSSLDLAVGRNGEAGFDGLISAAGGERQPAPEGGSTIPLGPTQEELKQAKQLYDGLPQSVRGIPALTPPTDEKRMPQADNTDNSNTQFGTLGLWAAGRHGVPMERALALLAHRFQVSQTPNGGWFYNFVMHPQGGEQPAMTGAGLLGLAVGHGVTADLKGKDVETVREDPQVEKGMQCPVSAHRRRQNGAGLYFLWSVERVGMLYGRRSIGGKDWYPVGVDYLLPQQQGDGRWQAGGYPGATPITDTCFALLFLKRANLAQDLTTKLEFLTPLKN